MRPRIRVLHCWDVERLEPRQMLAGDVDPALGIDTDLAATPNQAPRAASPADAAQDRGMLRMIVRDTYLPGHPLLVRLQLEDLEGNIHRETWDATASLRTDNPNIRLPQAEVSLVNGMGSILIDVEGTESFELIAELDGLRTTRGLTALDSSTIQTISGELTGETTRLDGVVQIVGDLVVPTGHVLTIEPGTLVLIDGVPQTPQLQLGTRIIVEGTLHAVATETQPITFTAMDPQRPWGEIHVDGGTAVLDFCILTRAGSSPRGGHTNTGPAIRLSSKGNLTLQHSSITDISGKILQSSSGDLTIASSLLARAVMGPEIEATQLAFEDSWIVEMAGMYHHNGTVDDNDGIYLHTQAKGQTIQMHRSVVAGVQDDGIDTYGAEVQFDDVIVRDFTDKAMSLFNGRATLQRGLLVNGDIGIETKGSGRATPTVTIDRTTIAQVNWGIRAFDKGSPDPDVRITYDVASSIVHVREGGDPLYTDYDPADFHVNYSWLAEDWQTSGSGEGNASGLPLFEDIAGNNFRPAAGSPAIDGGAPSAPLDADGTRADMGYFASRAASAPGDFNGDEKVDVLDIDLLCAALVSPSPDLSYDLDSSGQVGLEDIEFLVRNILRTNFGDANLDGRFDSNDLVLVLQHGQYEDDVVGNSRWSSGDWNCDGEFTTADLVIALEAGAYVSGP